MDGGTIGSLPVVLCGGAERSIFSNKPTYNRGYHRKQTTVKKIICVLPSQLLRGQLQRSCMPELKSNLRKSMKQEVARDLQISIPSIKFLRWRFFFGNNIDFPDNPIYRFRDEWQYM